MLLQARQAEELDAEDFGLPVCSAEKTKSIAHLVSPSPPHYRTPALLILHSRPP